MCGFDSRWRYHKRPYFTDFFRSRSLDWPTFGPRARLGTNSVALFCTLKDRVEPIGGLCFEIAEHVRVEVRGDRRRRVAEHLRHDL